jgi:hypothetical protein
MKHLVLIALAVVAVVAVAAPIAQGFDRAPRYTVWGTPDYWGQSISQAQSFTRSKYPAAPRVYCEGAWIGGHRAESSWVHGTTRYWDKLACYALNPNGKAWTSFVSDAK